MSEVRAQLPERSLCTSLRPTNPVAPVMATVISVSSSLPPVALQHKYTSLALLLLLLAVGLRAVKEKEEGKGRMAMAMLCLRTEVWIRGLLPSRSCACTMK